MNSLASLIGGRIYLDANIFIYAVEGFPKYQELCEGLLKAIDDGAIQAVTSELTVAEVFVKPLRDQNLAAVSTYEELLQNRPSLSLVPVSRVVLRQAAELRAQSNGKLPDAIHVATALQSGVNIIVTADRSLKTARSVRCVTLDELLEGGMP
jgi:predicted nucleic acid-binding protein